MPSTFTPNLNLEKIATGEQNDTWGATEGANWDKIDALTGGIIVQQTAVVSGSLTVDCALPSKFARYELHWRRLTFSGSDQLGIQYSIDNAASYLVGGYRYVWVDNVTGSSFSDNSTSIYPTPSGIGTGAPMMGSIEFDATYSKMTSGHCASYLSSGPLVRRDFFGATGNLTTATNIRLLAANGTLFSGGYVTLIGHVS